MLLRRKASASNGYFASQVDNKTQKESKAPVKQSAPSSKPTHAKGASSSMTASTSSCLTNQGTRVATATATPTTMLNSAMRTVTAATACSLSCVALPIDQIATMRTMQSQISESSAVILTTTANAHRRSQTGYSEFLPLNRRASQSSRDSTPHLTSRTTLNTQQTPFMDTIFGRSKADEERQVIQQQKLPVGNNFFTSIQIDGTMKQYQPQDASSLAKWAQLVGRTTEAEVRSEKMHYLDRGSPKSSRVIYPLEQETPKFNLGLRTVTLPEQINPQKIEERSRERRISIKHTRNLNSYQAVKNKGILPDTTDREIPINKRGSAGDLYAVRDLLGQLPIKMEGDSNSVKVFEMTPVRYLFENSYNHEITALLGQYDPQKKGQVQSQRGTSAIDQAASGIVSASTAKYVLEASQLEKFKIPLGSDTQVSSKSFKSTGKLDMTTTSSVVVSSTDLKAVSKHDTALNLAFENAYQVKRSRKRSRTNVSLSSASQEKKSLKNDILDLQNCLRKEPQVRVECIDLSNYSDVQGNRSSLLSLSKRTSTEEIGTGRDSLMSAAAGREIYVSQVRIASPSRALRFSLEQRASKLTEDGQPNQTMFNKRGRSKSNQRMRGSFTDIHYRGDPLWGEIREGSVSSSTNIPLVGKAIVPTARLHTTGDGSFWFDDQRQENIWRDELRLKELQANSIVMDKVGRRGSLCIPGQTPTVVNVCLRTLSQMNGGAGESSKPISRHPSPARRDSISSTDPYKEQRTRMLVGSVQLI